MAFLTAPVAQQVPTPERAAAARPVPERVRVAIVGCGAASRELHLPVLAGAREAEVTALVDRDLARARELARAYRVPRVLADSRELDPSFVDAVILCTPPFHHAPGSIELARRGFHVLVEKPMATRYEDALAMVRASRENGVALSVGVFRRLLPSTRMFRALIDSGLLGAPLSFDVEEGEVYAWPTATLGNHRRELAGGGVLIDYGSHTLDRLTFFFPGPAEVLEYHDNSRGGIESDCRVKLRLTTAGMRPVEGAVELSRTRNLRNSYRVHFERGTIELHCGERYRVQVRPQGASLVDVQSAKPRESEILAGWKGEDEAPWFEAFRAQLDDWLGAIRTGARPVLDGETVLPSLKLIRDSYARTPVPLKEPWVEETLKLPATPPFGVRPGNGPPKRVLITGATGFIGGRLAEVLSLRDGWQVRALVHNPAHASRLARLPVEMVMGSLGGDEDAAGLTEGCDAVVHCAIGTSWGNRKQIFDVTVGGARRLTQAALASKVSRFVHLSTFAVHDLTASGVIDEQTPPAPPRGNDYAESKLEADRVVADAAGRGLCAVTLRLANVYGPFSTIFTTRPISHLAKGNLVLLGDADRIPCSTVYVDSVIEAIVGALAAPAGAVKGELFTISDGDELTWAEFYGYYASALGVPLRVLPIGELGRRKARAGESWLRRCLTPLVGVKEVLTSREMWELTKRVLKTEPLYSTGKWTLEKAPPLGRVVKRWLGIDGPVVYQSEPAEGANAEAFEFDLTRPLVKNDKARRVLGFTPPYPRQQAMQMTLDWLRHARIVPGAGT
jgi:predicted dehydrogenase/nucleoside-diphosphate-sugar epimerase